VSAHRTRSLARAFASGAALAAAIAGCAGVFNIETLSSSEYDGGAADAADVTAPANDAGTTDTGAMDAFVADTGTDSPCGRVGIPDPPTTDVPGDGGDVTFTVALDRVDFGIAPDAGGPAVPVGYNLDKFCTVSSLGGNSCGTSTSGTAFSTYVVDKDMNGLDNAGFNLIKYLTTLGDAFKPEEVNARLQAGQFSIVIVVGGYNGGPEDTSVTVDAFPSYGLSGASGQEPVIFAASDVWLIDQNAYVPGTSGSLYRSATAYVTGGKLVAQLPSLAFTISVSDPDPRLTLAFNDVVATADIVPTMGSKSLYRATNGILAGRWATRTFFGAVAPLAYQGAPICTSGAFAILHNQVCGARDIMANGVNDDTGASCDAISVGMAFDSYAVDTTAKGTAPTSADGCPDAGDCQ
jgi:hypothetical protein